MRIQKAIAYMRNFRGEIISIRKGADQQMQGYDILRCSKAVHRSRKINSGGLTHKLAAKRNFYSE